MKTNGLSQSLTNEQYIELIQKLNNINDYFYNILTTSRNPLDLKYGIITTALDKIARGEIEFIYENLFKLLDIIEIIIPEDYTKLIENFNKNSFSYYNPEFDKNNLNASISLLPGEKYKIKIFEINDHSKKTFGFFKRNKKKTQQFVNSEIVIEFLKRQKAILNGSIAIKLLYAINKNNFPFERWILSFEDYEYYSRISNEERGIPAIYRRADDDDWAVALSSFEEGINPAVCNFIAFTKNST
jgi:hypothetical protein